MTTASAPAKFAYIMRGISGSGKSTVARQLAGAHGVIHSTDNYAYVNGVYVFDPVRNAEYHQRNLEAFRADAARGVPLLICDNTNIRRSQFMPYVEAAQQHGYAVAIVALPVPDLETALARNLHGTPRAVLEAMISGWEPY